MALTKQDIETAIGQTEHQDVIRHSLSNYFEGLDQPVAVAIAVNETGVRGWVNEGNIETIVNALRAKGIDAVSMMDPEASRPDKYVVNGNGIQTPFLSPEDALKATTVSKRFVVMPDLSCRDMPMCRRMTQCYTRRGKMLWARINRSI